MPAVRGRPFRSGPRTEVADPQHYAPLDPRPRSASSRAVVHPSARRPATDENPQRRRIAAGIRNDPPVSEPVQTGSMSHASATAEPPEEPPALSRGSKGFPVAPHTKLRVFAPAPNSGTLVLQRMIAPALRTSATMAASCAGTWLR